jgi:hypothetical protein
VAKRRHTAEQVISRLPEAEVLLAEGTDTPQIGRQFGVAEQTDYRWCKEDGGVRMHQIKRLEEP